MGVAFATRMHVATDGYCQPNPGGRATWAFLVKEGDEVVHEANGVAADTAGSSALAEWRAAYEALAWLDGNVTDARVRFVNDNARVIQALAGKGPVPPEGDERRLAQECRRLTYALRDRDVLVAFARIPRWENTEADRLAHAAFDGEDTAPEPVDAEGEAETEPEFALPPSLKEKRRREHG